MLLEDSAHGCGMVLGKSQLLDLLPKNAFTTAIASCAGQHKIDACHGGFSFIS